jgi:hypothetical protein
MRFNRRRSSRDAVMLPLHQAEQHPAIDQSTAGNARWSELPAVAAASGLEITCQLDRSELPDCQEGQQEKNCLPAFAIRDRREDDPSQD